MTKFGKLGICIPEDVLEVVESKEKGYIYIFTFPNGKHYVGLTSEHYTARWRRHKNRSENANDKHHKLPIYNAIRKYGWNKVDKKIICECDKKQLDELEIKYIAEYDSLFPNGYNLTTGGNIGTKYVDSVKISRGIALKEHRIKNPVSDETKLKMSQRKKEYLANNPDTVKKLADHNRGSKRDPLFLEKNHACHRKNKNDNLPRFMRRECRTHKNGNKIEFYRLTGHPKCKNKSFTKEIGCRKYLFMLDYSTTMKAIANKLAEIQISQAKVIQSTNLVQAALELFQKTLESKIAEQELGSETK